jgi:hypothetical protein
MFLIDETSPWVLKLNADKFILDCDLYPDCISMEIVAGL